MTSGSSRQRFIIANGKQNGPCDKEAMKAKPHSGHQFSRPANHG